MIHKSMWHSSFTAKGDFLVLVNLFQLQAGPPLDLLCITSQDKEGWIAYIHCPYTHTYPKKPESKPRFRNVGPGFVKHSSCGVWAPSHRLQVGWLLLGCKNKGVLQFPQVTGHECQHSCISEGEEAISGSPYSSQLSAGQDQQSVSLNSTTQLPSVPASPAAPHSLVLPTPYGFCLLLSPWASPGF